MPDPTKFEKKGEWMDACMHQAVSVEGKPQGQSVAMCLDIWRTSGKKKSEKKSEKKADDVPVQDYLRDLATSIIYKYSEDLPGDVTQPDVKGFYDKDISMETIDNKNFRKVLYTGEKSQLVVMSLKPGEDIGEEVHDVDQFFRVEQGKGIVTINDSSYRIEDDSSVIVPAGAKHNVRNTGKEDLKVYTVYSPPHHADGTTHKTKEDALKAEEEFSGETTEKLVKTAKLSEKYSYASTQVNLPKDISDQVIAWGKESISKEELADIGLEDEIHTTVLYGLKSNDPGDVNRLLRYFRPFEVRLGLITHFETPDYDVLKISVESPTLENMHYFLEENLDNVNSYPVYHPHVTIAYLKKGMAKKYLGNDCFRGSRFTADSIVFSTKDNKKIVLNLK